MQTRYWNLQNDTDGVMLREAAALIKQGEAVAFPTETVYGLGADGLNGEAVRKIFEAKGRPNDNPLILHIADKEDILKLTTGLTKQAQLLIEKFWPGPLTVIVAKSSIVPDEVSAGLDTVAVRMPSHPVAAQLIRLAGTPVAAPSANLSGKPSPTDAETVLADMQGRIAGIIDGGACTVGVESTIVDTTGEVPVILRPGGITREQLEEVLGRVELDPALAGAETLKPRAPGMKYRHYAPKAKLLIVEGDLREEILAIRQLVYAAHREGRRVGVIATTETLPFYKYGIVKNIGTRENEKTIARNLYRVLREFDEENVETIYSESFAVQGMGKAIMNRLEKAAGHLRISASAVAKQQKYRRITFVCGTDTALAPMAAEILRHYDLKQEYVIDSRGIVVLFPEPANQKAEAIMKSAQMTLEGHVSRGVDEENFQEDSLILAIDESQKHKLLAEYGQAQNIYTLSEFVESDVEVPDPYGKPLTAYGECFEILRELVEKLAKKLDSLVEEEQ